jgi:hypothetical protein
MEEKTYRIINRDNKIVNISISHRTIRGSFTSRGQLLSFLHKRFDIGYREGVDDIVHANWILNKCCHNWNDVHYTWKVKYNENVYIGCFRIAHHYEYMILDPHDRIMNIPDLARESFKFKKDIDIPDNRQYRYFSNEPWERYKRRSPIYFEGGSYYRNMRVQQERRMACDVMHKPYVRGKRNLHCLDPWNIERMVCSESGWKIIRIRKQWMENQKVCRTKKKNYRSLRRMA